MSEPSIELLGIKDSNNYGHSLTFPPSINDIDCYNLIQHLPSLQTVGCVDLSNTNVTLNRKTPGVTAAQSRLEHEIDLQDNRVRRASPSRKTSSPSSRSRSRKQRTSPSRSTTPPTFTQFYNPFQRTIVNKVSPARWCFSCSHLLAISLSNCAYLTDRSLSSLVQTMPVIQSLNILQCPRVTNVGVQTLSSLASLRLLNVSYNRNITGKGVKDFFGTVEHLILAGCSQITDEIILGAVRKKCNTGKHRNKATMLYVHAPQHQRKQVPMRTLHLNECSLLTDHSLLRVRLSTLSSLTSLSLSQCTSLTDASVSNILLHLSAPIVHLDVSFCPHVTNAALEQLSHNPGNKTIAGSHVGGKLRFLKSFFVQNSGVETLDFLSWLVERATEIISLGIGQDVRCNNNGGHINPPQLRITTKKKKRIGFLLSQLRRLSVLVVGDQHVEELIQLDEPSEDTPTRNTVTAFDAVISRALSDNQYQQFKSGEHSFTYRLPASHPETILQKALVTTKQSTIPTSCESHRGSHIAINGIRKGFYGDTVIDKEATTTITSLEKQASWSVDLGRQEKIGCIKILLPERHPPTFLLQSQFPFWVFCYRNSNACQNIDIEDKCPSNAMTHHSVYSYRVEWNSQCLVGRAVWLKVPIDVPAFQIVRIQQETIAAASGRCLSLCEVQILPLRLQRVEYNTKMQYSVTGSGSGRRRNSSSRSRIDTGKRTATSSSRTTLVSVDAHLAKHNPHLQDNPIMCLMHQKDQHQKVHDDACALPSLM